jgi:hypothetical protein
MIATTLGEIVKTCWKHLIFGVCLCFGGQAQAAGFLYDCTIAKKPSRLQWVSDTLAFVVPGDGKILVIDAITLYFKLSPMTAKVSRNTDTKLVMQWVIRGVKDSNGLKVPPIDYTARLNKITNAITIEANPRGFSQNWVGRGSCVKRTK